MRSYYMHKTYQRTQLSGPSVHDHWERERSKFTCTNSRKFCISDSSDSKTWNDNFHNLKFLAILDSFRANQESKMLQNHKYSQWSHMWLTCLHPTYQSVWKHVLEWHVVGCGFFFFSPTLINSHKESPRLEPYDCEQRKTGWTGWIWEIIGWSSRLQENYWSF